MRIFPRNLIRRILRSPYERLFNLTPAGHRAKSLEYTLEILKKKQGDYGKLLSESARGSYDLKLLEKRQKLQRYIDDIAAQLTREQKLAKKQIYLGLGGTGALSGALYGLHHMHALKRAAARRAAIRKGLFTTALLSGAGIASYSLMHPRRYKK